MTVFCSKKYDSLKSYISCPPDHFNRSYLLKTACMSGLKSAWGAHIFTTHSSFVNTSLCVGEGVYMVFVHTHSLYIWPLLMCVLVHQYRLRGHFMELSRPLPAQHQTADWQSEQLAQLTTLKGDWIMDFDSFGTKCSKWMLILFGVCRQLNASTLAITTS